MDTTIDNVLAGNSNDVKYVNNMMSKAGTVKQTLQFYGILAAVGAMWAVSKPPRKFQAMLV